MKTVYLAISKSNRIHFDAEVTLLKSYLQEKNYQLLVFVDQYEFNPDQEKEMMATAFDAIDNSDILVAELSKKAIGVGVEVGYAIAKQKQVIYIRRKTAAHSTTVGGSAQHTIEYKDADDLIQKLGKVNIF